MRNDFFCFNMNLDYGNNDYDEDDYDDYAFNELLDCKKIMKSWWL